MRRKLGAAAAAAVLACAGLASATGDEARYHFDVYLDDRLIGSHEYTISRPVSGYERVQSEADFDVRFLAIPVYRYEHRNTELWHGDCLESVNATTRTNGRLVEVVGKRTEKGFTIDGRADDALPDCVRTFAYWNPGLLEQKQLLNPQTGQLVAVEIERVAPDSMAAIGGEVPATVYRISTGEREIAVWYSASQQWLGLETEVRDGRTLRYVKS